MMPKRRMALLDIIPKLFILRGELAFTRSDNGPEMVVQTFGDRIDAAGTRIRHIARENRHCQSFKTATVIWVPKSAVPLEAKVTIFLIELLVLSLRGPVSNIEAGRVSATLLTPLCHTAKG